MRITTLARLFVLLSGALVLIQVTSNARVDALCKQNRIRKSYDALTDVERDTYKRALQLAMDKGYYIKYIEMHTEKMSEMEAHRVCMFTYWHRYFLIGFENMLRSLGPEFECVTIPYWDEMQANARYTASSCKNLEDCSFIIRDLGGSSSGPTKGISINGVWVSGDRCVNTAPLNHFCENSSKNGTACAKCVPRSNLQTKKYPGSTNFASIYRQLFTSGAFVATGKSIEEGMHNSLHAELGGAMGTFQSPADPLFWSHHAYVDLLLAIYFKCRVGFGKLTDDMKKNNQYAFVKCPHREDSGFFTSSSTVTMRNGQFGVNPKQVSQDGQALYPFFQGVPNWYYQLSDITQLGGNRYSYQVGGLVGQMASKCDNATATARRLEGELQTATTRRLGCTSDVGAQESAPGIIVNQEEDNEISTVQINQWMDDVREELGLLDKSQHPLDEQKTVEQMEKMVCMFYDQCRGGVHDYPEEFKKAFHVTEPPPCKKIVDELKSKGGATDPIRLPAWKKLMEEYFPCNTNHEVAYKSNDDVDD